jgi:membrane protease YdiL (CAAX protease family)
MKPRLESADYRFIAICVLLGAAATWYSARNFYRAFPEASIDFRVNRPDGRMLAERFLAERNFTVAGYRQAARFDYDDQAKTFLEREAGLERANGLMSTRVRLWHWSYRWFRPQQKEEFRVNITPAGDLAGFTHELPEDAARPNLPSADARGLAETFLRTVVRREPAALEFVEVNEQARPHRMDRQFVWKERDFNLHDATYRVSVTVLGNEVGGFGEFLKVPEQWQRDYEGLRSKNEMAQSVDQAFMILLLAGLLVTIVIRTRRQDVRWRRASLVGLGGFALSLCAALNSFPLAEFGFRTTDSYGSFLSRQLINAAGEALAVGGFLFLITAGAEPLYREAYANRVSLGNLFRLRGLRTRSFLKGSILGVTLAAIFIAYQTAFYLTASKLGAWSPADVPYSDELNTAFPWLFVLFGGYFPAVFEEFTFRMFAIPFLQKAFRWLPVAVVAAGFLWGFGHSSYPQQPFFIRGMEVGIGGVALGIIMLRWGILPTLVWHYSVDAMYSAMLMLRSHSLYFKLSGAASAGIVVLPIVAAVAAYWLKGGFAPEQGLLNGDEAAPIEPQAPAEPVATAEALPYTALSSRTRIAAVAIFAAGLATLLIPVAHFGDSPKFKLDAGQAKTYADSFLHTQGIDATRFRHVTSAGVHWGGSDSVAGKYFLEHVPMAAASRLFESYRPVRFWAVRYFRPLDQEEVEVAVHPETGQVSGFDHTIPEDRPGADASDDAARQAAVAFGASRGLDLASMDLKENASEKKKARRDHTLVWEARAGDARNVEDARYRVEIEVNGDQVAQWRTFWKISEDFARARARQNWVSIGAAGWRILVSVIVAFAGIWLLVHHIRHGLVPWKTVLRLSAVAALLTGVANLLLLPQMFDRYDTAIPLATFEATSFIGEAVSVIVAFFAFTIAAGLLVSLFPDCLQAFRPARRQFTAVDAVAATLAAAGFAIACGHLGALMNGWFPAQAIPGGGAPSLLESVFPAASALSSAARGILTVGAGASVIAVLARRLPGRWLAPAAAAGALGLVSGDVRTPAELAVSLVPILFAAACVLIFCRWFGRANYVAYALIFWFAGLCGPLSDLLENPNPQNLMQGWIVLGVAAAILVWLVIPAARQPRKLAAAA